MSSRKDRADTIVEAVIGFAVLAAVAVVAYSIMTRSSAAAQRSLEVTQVREQINAQAELLRYVRDNEKTMWDAIKGKAVASNIASSTQGGSCLQIAPSGSFVLGRKNSRVDLVSLDGTNYVQPSTYSLVTYPDTGAGSTKAEGLWIQLTAAQGGGKAYDAHIGACWMGLGSDVPMTLTTIVRLYDT